MIALGGKFPQHGRYSWAIEESWPRQRVATCRHSLRKEEPEQGHRRPGGDPWQVLGGGDRARQGLGQINHAGIQKYLPRGRFASLFVLLTITDDYRVSALSAP